MPGLILLSIGDGVTFTVISIAAGMGVADRQQGVASSVVSTSSSVGAAVGLALLVVVANTGIGGFDGIARQTAVADGLRAAVLVVAGGILVIALVALNLRPGPESTGGSPCPRALTSARPRR